LQQPKKKILFISFIRLFPPELGGHIRPAAFCAALARMGYEVEVYSLTGRRADYTAKKHSFSHEPLKNVIEHIDMSFINFVCHQLFKRLGLPPLWPHLLALFGLLPRLLKDKMKRADLIVSEFIFSPSKQRHVPHKPWYLDSHNLEHEKETSLGGIHKLYARLIKIMERRAPERYDGIFACTEHEMMFFSHARSSVSNCSVIHAPNGIDAASYLPQESCARDLRHRLGIREHDKVFLFCGSRYFANEDAVRFIRQFAEKHEAWLKEQRIVFLVVGSVEREPLHSGQYLATAFVEDPKPYFWAADYLINPMELGSGSNIKIAEAIAAHLPIVSTLFGVRGFNLHPCQDYIAFCRETLLCTLESLLRSDYAELKNRSRALRERVLADIDGYEICKNRLVPEIERPRSPATYQTF
jgi:hypothetical protein